MRTSVLVLYALPFSLAAADAQSAMLRRAGVGEKWLRRQSESLSNLECATDYGTFQMHEPLLPKDDSHLSQTCSLHISHH